MKILAIETSCDETAIALLDINGPMERPDIKVLGNALMSQAHLHSDFGGVYPNLAKREHQKNLPILLEQVLEQAGAIPPAGADVDYISVTQGPGLEPALWNGITFAEELSAKWGKPIIPVDHLDGHVYSTLYGLKKGERLDLPALALIVSGGHTELAYIQNFGDYEIIGRTKDDAVGEAFDKVARMLGLPYPGGPKISSLAELSRKRNPIGREFPDADREQAMGFRFPRPMINSGDLNFSFSGLKTAVLYKLKTLEMTDEVKQEVARAFEDAAIDALIAKTHTALESKVSEVKTLIVAGGVSGNQYLQKRLIGLTQLFPTITLRLPIKELTTDNAIMIALAAFVRMETGYKPDTERIIARGTKTRRRSLKPGEA